MVDFENKVLEGYSFIDLFAGIGGFRLALESLGASCVFSSEIDEESSKTYEINFKEKPFGDITKVNYPFAKDKWASRFTATCLLFRRIRSLTVAPHVYSQVPYEVLMSCTDNANIQLFI